LQGGSADNGSVMETGSLEERFIERLRAFDADAWGELYDGHRPRLWRYVYARSGSRDLTDEIVQQTFAEAVTSVRRYSGRGKPIIAWLYAIARNHTSKALRRNRREAPMPPDLEANPIDARVETMALQAALSVLPQAQREVLILRFIAGYETEEIAKATGKSVAAVYSLQARALRSSRRALERQGISGWTDEFGAQRV
jgi:RNA polymerase sigma-70 factor (ECF subfamily)